MPQALHFWPLLNILTIILSKRWLRFEMKMPMAGVLHIFLLGIISSDNQLVFNIWNRWYSVPFWFWKFFPMREQWALDRRSPIQKWPINTAPVDTQIDWNSHKIQVFSSLQPNFGTSWKVAWVLYSERYVRVVVTEKFWKNLKLSKYFNKSAPCHTSLPDQLNLDRHSLRPLSKSLEDALSSLGFTRTKDNFRNSDSLLNYYHIVFFGTMNKRNKEKNAHWSNLQKKFNQTRFRLVEERGSSTFNGKVSTEFWIWTTKFGELSSCIQNHNMVMHSMQKADICHDRQSQPAVVHFFKAGIFFGKTNANFWPSLTN